jgi:hypothetical protein
MKTQLILKRKMFLFAFVALCMPMLSYAAITGQANSEEWSATVGGANVQGKGTSEIFWGGTTLATTSAYLITPPTNPSIFPITLGQPFLIGTFTSINHEIPVGTGITDSTLSLILSFDINGTTFSDLKFNYDITHDETPNYGTCPPGSSSVCDDIAGFGNNTTQTQLFTVDGQQYEFELLGAEVNGLPVQQLLVAENTSASAQIMGVIYEVNTPEPSTYLILGSTLCMALWAVRKQSLCQ